MCRRLDGPTKWPSLASWEIPPKRARGSDKNMNQGCSPVYIGRYHKDDSDGDQAPLREAPSGQRPVTARGRVEQTSPLRNDNRQVASSDVARPDSSVIPGNPTSSQISVSSDTLPSHITGCTVSYRAVPCSAELPNWTGLDWAGLGWPHFLPL